jgi:uncharacterized protein with GYD domain
MILISLVKFRKKMTKEFAATTDKAMAALQKEGVKILGFYYTSGRYDAVLIVEGPDEGTALRTMRTAMAVSEYAAPETMMAVKREDALKLLG